MPVTVEEKAAEHFEQATADHEMEIIHDEGLWRHLRFRSPETWNYGYDLITWPGSLAIDGDLVSGLIFQRTQDMIDFFRSGPSINPGYWSEKITNPAARDATRRYSPDRLAEHIAELDSDEVKAQWAEHILYRDLEFEYQAREAISDFKPISDWAWEWDLREWDHVFLMICWAIRTGAQRYREQDDR
jgi:hypothetical protein